MVNPPGPEKEQNKPLEVEDIFSEQDQEQRSAPEIRESTVETAPESAQEVRKEQRTETQEDEDAQRKYAPPPVQKHIQKSEELAKIESIMSEHLDELYIQMPPEQQREFGQKGEEAATKIEGLLQEVKVRVKEVLNLLRGWLKMIPGVNKFFIEQEAKIKADRILNIHEQKHKQK